MDYIPISRHNARAWNLEKMDTSVQLKCPDQAGVLTVCDYSKSARSLARLSMDIATDGRGFMMSRDDSLPIQAQYVRPHKQYDPNGLNIFEEPVDSVSVRKDTASGLWHIEREWDEVADLKGLNTLVWAMAKYSFDKKAALITQ